MRFALAQGASLLFVPFAGVGALRLLLEPLAHPRRFRPSSPSKWPRAR